MKHHQNHRHVIFADYEAQVTVLQTALGVKLLGRAKDDPGTEKFLDNFYKVCMDILIKPFDEIPEVKNLCSS